MKKRNISILIGGFILATSLTFSTSVQASSVGSPGSGSHSNGGVIDGGGGGGFSGGGGFINETNTNPTENAKPVEEKKDETKLVETVEVFDDNVAKSEANSDITYKVTKKNVSAKIKMSGRDSDGASVITVSNSILDEAIATAKQKAVTKKAKANLIVEVNNKNWKASNDFTVGDGGIKKLSVKNIAIFRLSNKKSVVSFGRNVLNYLAKKASKGFTIVIENFKNSIQVSLRDSNGKDIKYLNQKFNVSFKANLGKKQKVYMGKTALKYNKKKGVVTVTLKNPGKIVIK